MFEHCLQLARTNEGAGGAKVAAIIEHNRGISTGVNQYKSHPLQLRYSNKPAAIFMHAEIDALRNALRVLRDPNELIGATIYVARSLKDGTPASSRPCEAICLPTLRAFMLGEMHYLTFDNTQQTERIVP